MNLNLPPGVLPVLTIRVNTNGSVTVDGPLGDRMLCYGMIEMAKDIIQKLNDNVAEGRQPIQLARKIPGPAPGENNGGRMN